MNQRLAISASVEQFPT